MVCLFVKIFRLPAISATPEEKTDLFDIGNNLVDEVNLSTIELEVYDLRELFLNNTVLYFNFWRGWNRNYVLRHCSC
jgi:hypothetical protein